MSNGNILGPVWPERVRSRAAHESCDNWGGETDTTGVSLTVEAGGVGRRIREGEKGPIVGKANELVLSNVKSTVCGWAPCVAGADNARDRSSMSQLNS